MSNIRRLSKKIFDEHPVWGWIEDESGYIPILNIPPLPLDCGPLLVRAQLISHSGQILDGCVIGLKSIYAIVIFVGDERFIFNIHMEHADIIQSASELFFALGLKPFKLFPVKYKSIYSYSDSTTVEGVFCIESCDI